MGVHPTLQLLFLFFLFKKPLPFPNTLSLIHELFTQFGKTLYCLCTSFEDPFHMTRMSMTGLGIVFTVYAREFDSSDRIVPVAQVVRAVV